MRFWVALLALLALSATSFAQDDFEDGEVANAEGPSDEEIPFDETPAQGEETDDIPSDDGEDNEEVGEEVGEAEEVPASEVPAEIESADAAETEEGNGDDFEEVGQAEGDDGEGEGTDDGDDDEENESPAEWNKNKTYPLYSASIDVARDCGCKIKWMKKTYKRPQPKAKYFHFHESVGFHNKHFPRVTYHHHKRCRPFPRRAHIHHVVRHHVHHKKPCGCLRKTIVKHVHTHHPHHPHFHFHKPCNGKRWKFNHHH